MPARGRGYLYSFYAFFAHTREPPLCQVSLSVPPGAGKFDFMGWGVCCHQRSGVTSTRRLWCLSQWQDGHSTTRLTRPSSSYSDRARSGRCRSSLTWWTVLPRVMIAGLLWAQSQHLRRWCFMPAGCVATLVTCKRLVGCRLQSTAKPSSPDMRQGCTFSPTPAKSKWSGVCSTISCLHYTTGRL